MASFQFPQARILLFAKAPIPGLVKTRLQPQCSALRASQIHKALVCASLEKLSAANLAPIEMWCAPSTNHAFFHLCRRRYSVVLRRQLGSDLGARMYDAFRSSKQVRQPMILLGSDCGSLQVADIELAIDNLYQGIDVVIAPAEDGGYTLIGARKAWPSLFRCMPWGGAQVAQLTRQRMQRQKILFTELAMQWDVDNYQDYLRWKVQK